MSAGAGGGNSQELVVSCGGDEMVIQMIEPDQVKDLIASLRRLVEQGTYACQHCGGSGIEPDGNQP